MIHPYSTISVYHYIHVTPGYMCTATSGLCKNGSIDMNMQFYPLSIQTGPINYYASGSTSSNLFGYGGSATGQFWNDGPNIQPISQRPVLQRKRNQFDYLNKS